jgi:hypothetical protein
LEPYKTFSIDVKCGEVGTPYIEAISAIVANTNKYPIQTIRYPQIRPAVPPFRRPKMLVLHHPSEAKIGTFGKNTNIKAISHVDINVQAKPRVEMNRKFR